MIKIPKIKSEEIGILRNADMMDAIRESDEAKKKGVKTWKL